MSLVGPWLSTTSTKKKSEKITKKKQDELERGWKERNIRLKELRLPKETFEQYLEWVYGKGTKTKTRDVESKGSSDSFNGASKRIVETIQRTVQGTSQSQRESSAESLNLKITSKSDSVKGPCSSKPSPVYTGTKMVGIATMHKSNLVPVFSDEEVKDISKMRR